MWRKTVTRRLAKYLPLTVEAQRALDAEEVIATEPVPSGTRRPALPGRIAARIVGTPPLAEAPALASGDGPPPPAVAEVATGADEPRRCGSPSPYGDGGTCILPRAIPSGGCAPMARRPGSGRRHDGPARSPSLRLVPSTGQRRAPWRPHQRAPATVRREQPPAVRDRGVRGAARGGGPGRRRRAPPVPIMTAQSDPYVRVYYRIIDDRSSRASMTTTRGSRCGSGCCSSRTARTPRPRPFPMRSDGPPSGTSWRSGSSISSPATATASTAWMPSAVAEPAGVGCRPGEVAQGARGCR